MEQVIEMLKLAFEAANEEHLKGDTRMVQVKGKIVQTIGQYSPKESFALRGRIFKPNGVSPAVATSSTMRQNKFGPIIKKDPYPFKKKIAVQPVKSSSPTPTPEPVNDAPIKSDDKKTQELIIQAASADGRLSEEPSDLFKQLSDLSTQDIVKKYNGEVLNGLLEKFDIEHDTKARPMQKAAILRKYCLAQLNTDK